MDRGAFVYDVEADAYQCRKGVMLRFRKHKHTERERVSPPPAADCSACPRKARRTPSAKGRHVSRSFDEAYAERVQAYHATEV